MAVQNFLIMNLLRIITPEEIADIATKHNGGKFLSLTDLVNERVEKGIYRDFSSTDSIDEIHESHSKQNEEKNNTAKILPFNKKTEEPILPMPEDESTSRFVIQSKVISQRVEVPEEEVAQEQKRQIEHQENENMSSFILIEKERLKKSQKTLKQKEIINLYQKNLNVDVEQIKSTNSDPSSSNEVGVLVNKKQY